MRRFGLQVSDWTFLLSSPFAQRCISVLFTVFLFLPILLLQGTAGAQPAPDLQPPAVRKPLPGATLKHISPPQAVDTEDKGDYYLHEGRRINLLRARTEVAVQYKELVTAEQGFNALAGNPDLAGKIKRRKTLQSKRIDIVQELSGKNGTTMKTDALHGTIGRQPEVAHVYPILVNPQDNLRVIAFDEILLCLENHADINALAPYLSDISAVVDHQTSATDIRVYLVKLLDPASYDALSASTAMHDWPGVKWAEPNFLKEMQFSFTPNDPIFNQQQSLHNTGRNGALTDADVDAPDAWDITRGRDTVIVAIIDDGVDTSHPDLRIAPGGYDFGNNDSNPSPVGTNGHGTGCAGIVAAIGNNNYLISGIAPECSILPVKIIDDGGTFSTDEILGDAIRYAADRADILSNSWGGGPSSTYISSAISYAISSGRNGLGSPVFFATGNSASLWDQGGGRVRLPTTGLNGSYYFRFSYEKDESLSDGLDAALIDNMVLIAADGYTHLWREDFEGTFPPSGWTTAGSAGWRQTTSNVYTGTGGTKSAKSGAISHNQSSSLTTPLQTITGTETFAFALAISSEFYYDNLFIDVYDSSQAYIGSYGGISGVPYVMPSASYPASDPNSIAVGSATDRDLRSDYSQYGYNLDFLAPSNGGWNDITALDPLGSVGWNDTDIKSGFGGTSSACPLAAGIGALLLSLDPTYTALEVRSIMRRSCDKVGSLPYSGGDTNAGGRNDIYGYGRINAFSVLKNLYTRPPVITLNGTSEVTIECGGVYVDAGAVAEDMFHYDLTSSIVVTNPVDTTIPGTYTVQYNVSDRASNTTAATRTVHVVDTTSPAISLIGAASISIECGTEYVDSGASAADICAGDLTAALLITNMVNPFVPGIYAVHYNASDPSSNAAAEVLRTVTVIDTAAPVISLHGDPALTLHLCPDDPIPAIPGASAYDMCAGNLAADIVVGGDSISSAPGTYTITYDVADPSLNAAEPMVRTVTVETATGTNIYVDTLGETIECGDPFEQPTSQVRNGCDSPFAVAEVDGTVDTHVSGEYLLTYSYPDADPVEVTITVQDTISPVITMTGDYEITLQTGDEYTDAGATAYDTCDGDLTGNIMIDGAALNTFMASACYIKYNVSDTALNRAAEVVRTVTILDTKPRVEEVLVETENSVLVTFSKRMGMGVLDGAKYSVSGTGIGSLPENPASVEYTGNNTYRLTWEPCAGIMYDSGDITVTVAPDVQDIVGNAMVAPVSGTHTGGANSPLPVITMLGTNSVTVECGSGYTDAGAAAVDACGGDLTAFIVVSNPVDIMALGAYTVRYNVVDSGGNAALEATRVVYVEDTQPPSMHLTGSTILTIECGSTYIFPEAVAEDACEGRYDSVQTTLGTGEAGLTAWFWALDSEYVPLWNDDEPVRYAYNKLPSEPGNYLLIYTAVFESGITCPVLENGLPPLFDDSGLPDFLDDTGNITVDFARLVKVVDSQSPFITLDGDREITLTCNTPYVEPGMRASDFCEGNLTGQIVIEGTVNPDIAGTYTLTYRVTDRAGFSGAATRTVHVLENLPPTISVAGASVLLLECSGTAYSDAGATASDECDGDLTGSITVGGDTVASTTPGVYHITYDVNDSRGNAAIRQTRTVTVADTVRPVITISGEREVRVPYGGEYTDPGATAWDTCDGDLTEKIEIKSDTVDTSAPATYRIEYIVEDRSGNENNVIRQVIVQNPKTVLVPDIKGMTTDEALEALSSLLLQLEVSAEEYHATVPAGSIIRQNPMAGSSVQEGFIVTVVISKGTEPSQEGEPTEGEPATLEEIAAVLLEQFDSIEANENGLATYQQVQAVLPSLTEQQFSDIDMDGDGYLSREELLAVIEGATEECTGCRACLGCCKPEGKTLQEYLGDWLLVGLSMLALGYFRR